MKVDPQDLYKGLRERDVPHIHAMGILANMKAESNFDAGIQEKHPIAGRGGYGLAQWTGPRRRALETVRRQCSPQSLGLGAATGLSALRARHRPLS